MWLFKEVNQIVQITISALFSEPQLIDLNTEFALRDAGTATLLSVFKRFEVKYPEFKKCIFDLINECFDVSSKMFSIGNFYSASKFTNEISCYLLLDNVFPKLESARSSIRNDTDQRRFDRLVGILRVLY